MNKIVEKSSLFIFVIAVMTGLVLLTGCGQKKRDTTLIVESGDPVDFLGRVSMLTGTGGLNLGDNGGLRNPFNVNINGTGFLIIKKKSGLHVCNSFMVSPSILITNSHCYKSHEAFSTCETDILANIFTSAGVQQSFCKNILFQSVTSRSLNRPDYMIIELENSISMHHSDFKPVSRAGLVGDEEVMIPSFEVDYVTDHFMTAVLKTTTCKVPLKNGLSVGQAAKAPVLKLVTTEHDDRSCFVKEGYSGSMVINRQGQVVAINFAGPNRNDFPDLPNSSIVTNFKCLEQGMDYVTSDRLSSNCRLNHLPWL